MNIERYNYTISDLYLEYEFSSQGPKGTIVKVVRYTKIEGQYMIFNLGFGDKNAHNDIFDDAVVSNNNDRDKVLATVASTLMEFIVKYPLASIFAKGSTPSRTRLYQIGISQHFEELSQRFYIYGFANNEWQLFSRNINYEAFLVELK